MAASQVFVGLKEKHMGLPTLSVLICKMGIITRHWGPWILMTWREQGPGGAAQGWGGVGKPSGSLDQGFQETPIPSTRHS